jgi:hypothetical protein
MAFNQEAPAAKAPKGTEDYLRFPPFPAAAAGTNILTVVAFNFLPNYEFEKDDGSKYNADAIEFVYGTLIDGLPFFVKTWPKTYSISNKAYYFKLYTAALGKEPKPGSTPKDILGAGVLSSIEIKDKVSKKGKQYTACNVKGDPAPVMAKLKSEVVPLAVLQPHLEAALKAASEANKGDGNPY